MLLCFLVTILNEAEENKKKNVDTKMPAKTSKPFTDSTVQIGFVVRNRQNEV